MTTKGRLLWVVKMTQVVAAGELPDGPRET